jgi:hypothetical protein
VGYSVEEWSDGIEPFNLALSRHGTPCFIIVRAAESGPFTCILLATTT